MAIPYWQSDINIVQVNKVECNVPHGDNDFNYFITFIIISTITFSTEIKSLSRYQIRVKNCVCINIVHRKGFVECGYCI